MNILVVDDDEIVRELLAANLEKAGHSVSVAGDGEEALEMLRAGSFRLVVSDWIMPGMSGPELCQAIRSRHYGRYIYVIVVTSHNATNDIVAALEAGADDFIAKPVQAAELCVRVRAGERILALENRDVTILALAKMAIDYDIKAFPARLERIDGARMRLTVEDPLERRPDLGDKQAEAEAMMLQVNGILERWISERPGDWLWLHRRWDRP